MGLFMVWCDEIDEEIIALEENMTTKQHQKLRKTSMPSWMVTDAIDYNADDQKTKMHTKQILLFHTMMKNPG